MTDGTKGMEDERKWQARRPLS